jgi:hypothetical protein
MKPIQRKRKWLSCIVIVMSLGGATAVAETSSEFLVQAFKNADAATHKSTELTYMIDNATFRQVLTKVEPDRLHLVISPATGPSQEFFAIGGTFYTKQNDHWIESPALGPIGNAPDPTSGLDVIFSGLTERAHQMQNGKEQRVFSGQTRWQAGANWIEGSVEILIDLHSQLPTRTSFVGSCATKACSFTQSMEFGSNLSVDPPTPVLRASSGVTAAIGEQFCTHGGQDPQKGDSVACYSDAGCRFAASLGAEPVRDFSPSSAPFALARGKITGIITSSSGLITQIKKVGGSCRRV